MRAAGCVWAEDEADVLLESASNAETLVDLIARRVSGEPLEQLVGWVRFDGKRYAVAPGVFVPRQRTVLLVDVAAKLPGHVVVDLGCGTGVLGAALDRRRPIELYATDLDPAAVAIARRNVPVGSTVVQGDLFDALPRSLLGRVDLVLANAPYVPTGELRLLPAEAREHENPLALDGGTDGLDLHRRIAVAAPRWLARGGHLVIEVGERQQAAATALLSAAGLAVRVHRDADVGTVVLAAERCR